MRYILAILLMNALCAGPLLADALELKLDETLPSGPAPVETVVQPVVATATEVFPESTFPVVGVFAFFLVGLAVYLGWRFGVLKYIRTRIRAARPASGQNRYKQQKPQRPIPNKPQPRPTVKPALRSEPKRKSSPTLTRSQVTRTMSDLVMAKALVTEEAYDQAEVCIISALRSEPYNLDAYVVALKILSSYQTPQLIGMVRGGLQLLRLKNPRLWLDVAEQGRKLAPEIENWDDAPEMKRNS